jgi:hypothetical protein
MTKTVINTKTQEEYNKVMQIFEKKGWKSDYRKATECNFWIYYKENTCVDYKNDFCYGSVRYSENHNEKILSYLEFLEAEAGLPIKKICKKCGREL